MKAVVKQQFLEFIEYIEFPALIYMYESGRIIARNQLARELLDDKIRNMNMAWGDRKRQKLDRSLLANGSRIFFRKILQNGKDRMEVDMEITSFGLDYRHIIICFFEQSYKKAFEEGCGQHLPRLYLKDKKLHIIDTNSIFKQAGEVRYLTGKKNEPSWQEFFHGVREKEMRIIREKKSCCELEQIFWEEGKAPIFVKDCRIPIINKNGTCLGILGAFTPILDRKESRSRHNRLLRENDVLNRALQRTELFACCFYQSEGWPVEYVSPDLKRLGFPVQTLLVGSMTWKDIMDPVDYVRVFREYRKKEEKNGTILCYRLIRPNGETVYIRDQTVYTGLDNGKAFREAILRQITEDEFNETLKSGGRERTVSLPVVPNGREQRLYHDFLKGNPQGLTPEREKEDELAFYLRSAVKKGCVEFDVYYQPVVGSKAREMIGAEALLRWKSPELGFINPVDFIPLSEYLGLIVPLGEYVIREVFQTSRKWNEGREEPLLLNINLSVIQLVQPDITEIIHRLAREFCIDCSRIVFEVTESLAIEDMTLMKNVLLELKKQGFQIALDDFGTGFSSLSHIMEMPLDYIKVDKSFISAYGTEKFNPGLLSAITELAHSMNVKIIVEGVETKQQMEFLMFLNTDEYQGYLFGKPMPKEEFEQEKLMKGKTNKSF